MAFRNSLLLATIAVMTMGSAADVAAAQWPAAQAAHIPVDVMEAEQARVRAIDFEMAPIKSVEDLSEYLRSAGPDSPLMALSPGGRERFFDSLQFNENGLVSYSYEDLARELTASEVYRILALFGAQRTTHLLRARVESPADLAASATPRIPTLMADDHMEYRCISPHNCFKTPLFICLEGC